MAVLVIADHDNATLSDVTNKVVTAASQVGGDVDILVAGEGAGDVAAAAAGIAGDHRTCRAGGAADAARAVAVGLAIVRTARPKDRDDRGDGKRRVKTSIHGNLTNSFNRSGRSMCRMAARSASA